ncbi:DMT family transporter [Miltoncostaea marina]|uniref:DMT family transporter n=1 Tax=Miltoncostaea marina TaxID=2843215 RepID=UPI001C3C99CC|nr:DMT family transporter [Miltoncostaea marina]
MTRWIHILLPLIGGAMVAAQAPINARLRIVLGSQIGSAAISFAIGLLLLLAALAVVGEVGSLGDVGGGPWWAYLGGAAGAVFVVATLVAAPRIGVTATFVSVVSGQLALSALIDRYGWFGAKAIGTSWERVAALVLLLVSLVLLLRST